ncbi:hypothetical protein FWJ25_13405 [Marinobacter salinexigens]|uniref:Uncharacterized protein n=1 Tax=Marinobacter salinexigens TaxID=2919747 RepID=A0A5B0VEI0_9GAMM|nr:hypothetical protein [Marinobacter salinexigens]KAA1172804.1 hypothetical protein FWJ25_13405 [Marinobacter salinexigens]
MTDQVPTEYVRFRGESYVLLSADKALFSLWDHDIHPEDTDSSNWAGFVAHFDINDERLYLDYLTVGHTPPARKRIHRTWHQERSESDALMDEALGDYTLPPLNGVEATDAGMGYWHYQDINLALDYTGTLTLSPNSGANGQNYLELAFEKGRVVSCKTIAAPVSDDASSITTDGFSPDSDWYNLDNDPDIDPPQQP